MREDFRQKTLVTKPRAVEPQKVERQGTLTVLVGGDVGAVFVLDKATTVLGRDAEAGVSIDDDGVSRRHAQIVLHNGGYEVEDLGSTNGTFVGRERVQGRMRLQDGSRLLLGNTLLRFALQDQIEREASRRIYEMSVRDGLTGVFNRRYFDERLTSEFAFAARHGSALCVLMVDIDHFKRVNDRYGHQAGDMVLRRVAAELRSGIRTEDVIARYGGEEFAILARGIDPEGARLFGERVRMMAERAHIVCEDMHVPVTISVGLAHNHAGPTAQKAERLVAEADAALYGAKQAGRNRVVVASSSGRYSVVQDDAQGTHAKTPSKRRYWEQATRPQDERSSIDAVRSINNVRRPR
jgi:two-component system cell cycle response regulator